MRIDAPKRAQILALRALWKEAFGDTDAFLDSFERTAFAPQRCRCVTEDGAVAAALYWFDCLYDEKRIAYLYAIATARAYRGKGFCRRLMEDTHRHLRECGYEGAILVPAEESLFGFYRRMGYETCSTVRELSCTASEETVALRRIELDEYARLRREMLPRGGVIEEGEALALLGTQAVFYKGSEFVLAASTEEGELRGIELLGDVEAAPQIVRALGYGKGTFRIPGEGIPFAMYLPLGNGALPPPAYFGLALD